MSEEQVETQDGGDDKALSQDEIDSLLGFGGDEQEEKPKVGIDVMLDKSLTSYERLPMLEIVFDRFVRMLSTSLRNFTSDNVDVDIHSITSLRFGDYVNSIPVPAILSIFKALEWENFALVTFNGSLVYSMIEVLFGGRKLNKPIRIEGRPYTSIEQGMVKQLTEIVIVDLAAAFEPLSPATFNFERMETNPRFATISHPSDTVILLQLRVDMEERGGNLEVMFPLVTLEPIKELLGQAFMGESFGKDAYWEAHLTREVVNTHVKLEAVLGSKKTTMQHVIGLKPGDTIVLDSEPDDDVLVKSSGVSVLEGSVGRVSDNLAIVVNKMFNEKKGDSDESDS